MPEPATTHFEPSICLPIGLGLNNDEDRNATWMVDGSRVIVKNFSVNIVAKLFFIFCVP